MSSKRIGENIKKLRKRNGWTQQQLAEMLEVDRTTVVKWEKGENMPYKAVSSLAELFKASPERLAKDVEKPSGVLVPMNMPRWCGECPFLRMEYNLTTAQYTAYCPILVDELIHEIYSSVAYECPLEEVYI